MAAFLFVTASVALLAGLMAWWQGTCTGRRDARRTRALPFRRGRRAPSVLAGASRLMGGLTRQQQGRTRGPSPGGEHTNQNCRLVRGGQEP